MTNSWMRKHVDRSIPTGRISTAPLSMKCFFHKHLKWDELQRLNEGFILYFCIWRETSVKKQKNQTLWHHDLQKGDFPKEKNPYGGVQIKTSRKECSSNQWFPFWTCKEFTDKSRDKILQEKPFDVSCSVLVYQSGDSSSLSNTQYFNPLCNKTYKIALALPFSKEKCQKYCWIYFTLNKPILKILSTYVFYNILTMSLEKFEFPPVCTPSHHPLSTCPS